MAVPKRKQTKPKKPYPSFPLTAHNNGQWCKKIRGKIHFFGVWDDPQAALNSYLQVAEDLHAGRQPSTSSLSSDDLTVKNVCNHFLTYQLQKVENTEITSRCFEDYRRIAQNFAQSVGPNRLVCDLGPTDFQQYRHKLARHGLSRKGKGLGVHALIRTITVVRSILKYAYETDLIDKPIKYGKSFARPSAAFRRKNRQAIKLQNGNQLFEPHEIHAMLDIADIHLKAMILLGINGGFGNTDCARLPIKAICFDRKIIEFNRPKTSIERVVPLWPETITALHKAIAARPRPVDDDADKLLFLTKFGFPWVRQNVHTADDRGITKVITVDSIVRAFNKVLNELTIKRKGLGFYALRHTFRTWADETRDQHAIHRIMGHAIPGMSGIYVEEISLDRLQAVTEYVRGKLFGD